MSERMTDDVWHHLVRDEYPEDSHERIVAEAERARASEKALADALASVKTRVRGFQHAESCQTEDDDQESIEGCDCPLQLVPEIDAALRLAGRL